MSRSQKHAGLILVPWFNSNEWKYVYHSIYSNDRDKQLKALDLLKIWKLRTPILSTGVEGTLILLDVILLDTDSLSHEQISNLFAIALMRFLNLSAANSEKQGSFAKTSAKNELPKWLINLRHDIAHGHQIPSLYNLKMGLDFGFDWLKEKYWEPQSKIIKDYYIGEDAYTESPLINSLKAYMEISVALFENQELDNDYVQSLKDTIYKKFKKNVAHPYLMLDILLEMITQSLEKYRQREQLCLDLLVSSKALLKPHFGIFFSDEAEEGNTRLDKSFRNIWQSLLNIFHQYGLLFLLIDKLFDVVGNISYSDNSKKMAALWINELFISLNNLKGLENNEDILKLELNQHAYSEEALHFEKSVLNCCSQYSIYFLDSLLSYNMKDKTFHNDVHNLLKANSNVDMHQGVGKIYSLDDLKVEGLTLEDVLIENGVQNGITRVNSSTSQIIAGSKWQAIKDTSMFKYCPLGVLPHQIGQKHPFLVLS